MDYEKDTLSEEADFHIDASKIDSPYRVWSISMGGSIWSSPIIHDDTIFFGSNDTYFYALDLEGNKLWDYKTADMIFSSPTCYKDIVVVGSCDEYLYAFSKNSDLLWKFYAGSKIWTAPLIAEGVVYFGSNNGIFHALSVEDGKELWNVPNCGQEFVHAAGAVNDSIIFGNFNGDLRCISTDGRQIWKTQCGDHISQTQLIVDEYNNEVSSFRKRSFSSIPKCEKSRLFMGAGDGYFRCMRAEDGKVLWKIFANKIGGSSPITNNNIVYFGSLDGRMYAVSADGHIKWKFQASNRIMCSPIYKDGMIYFGSSDGNLYALDAKTGGFVWRFLTDNEVASAPIIQNDVIYFGGWDGNMYALSLKDRSLLWKFRTALGFPSYVRKPTMSAEDHKAQKLEFTETKTTKGYEVKSSNYSLSTGELTNAFYGSPVSQKKKSGYEGGHGEYH
jgi:outer membrane protein assembly factor BamB